MGSCRRNRRTALFEREDSPVGRDQPVALAGLRRRHAHDRFVELLGARGTVERRVAERKDAAIGRDQPVSARGAIRHARVGLGKHEITRLLDMPTIGWLSRIPLVEPRKGALPKAKTPPSDPTSQ